MILFYLTLARYFTDLQASRRSEIFDSSHFPNHCCNLLQRDTKAPKARRSTYYRLLSALSLLLDQERIQSIKRSVYLRVCIMARYMIVFHSALRRDILAETSTAIVQEMHLQQCSVNGQTKTCISPPPSTIYILKLTKRARHPQKQSTLLSLPLEIRRMIWQYLRMKRINYRHGSGLTGAYQIGLRNTTQYIIPLKPQIHDFYGLVFACRLTYTEIRQVHNPSTMYTHHYNVNKLLYLLQARRPIVIDELQLSIEGWGTCAMTSEINVNEVQHQIARALLELKRQYETVDFKKISWISLRSNRTGTGGGSGLETRHFRLRFEVHVGRKGQQALGGPIQRGKKYPAQVIAREIGWLEDRLGFNELDQLLNEMEDTPEEGMVNLDQSL